MGFEPAMDEARVANYLGALATGIDTRLETSLGSLAEGGPSAAAALLACRYGAARTVGEFAPILGLTDSGVVRLFNRLEAEGLVVRTAGRDRRTVAVTLTPKGHETARRLQKRRLAALGDALGVLDPPERQLLGKLLGKLLHALPVDRRDARNICRLCDHASCAGDACPVGSAVRERIATRPAVEGVRL
jgi:MarR family transcriptional repressor of emrRAB